jgi:hypothetical protein
LELGYVHLVFYKGLDCIEYLAVLNAGARGRV